MTGDQDDFFARLKNLLPVGWFGDESPIVDALARGMASVLAWAYSFYLYAQAQTRIKTASGGWLDMVALDFFGTGMTRRPMQSDGSYRNRIIINLFRERGTRHAISQVLYDLTGRWPIIVEPQRPADTGAYGVACGYGAAGAYGSMLMPYQALVTAFRPAGSGFPYLSGYAAPAGGYGHASRACYASLRDAVAVLDSDLIAAIEAVKPIGTTIWVGISS